MHRKIKLIRQLGETDCGIACLTMVLNYYGYNCSMSDVESEVLVGRDGMSILQMKEVAEKFGLDLHAYKYEFDDEQVNDLLPVVLCSATNHFVVVMKKIRNKFLVLNPSKGKELLTLEQLRQKYRNIIITFELVKKYEIKKNKKKKFHLNLNYFFLILSATMILISQGIILFIPRLTQEVIDASLYPKQYNIVKWLLVVGMIFSCYFLVNYFKQKIILITEIDLYKNTMERLINKIFKVDLNYFASHSSGDIMNRFSNTTTLFQFISSNLVSTIIDVITACICSVAMIQISFKLFTIVALITFIEVASIMLIYDKQKNVTQEYYGIQANLDNRLVDILTNMIEIREMGYEIKTKQKIEREYIDLISNSKRRNQYNNMINNIVKSINMVINLLIYVVGVYYIIQGKMTTGSMLAFVTLATYFVGPIQTSALIFPQLSSLKETMRRLKNIMEYPEQELDIGKIEIKHIEEIRLSNILYKYVSSDIDCLNNVSMKINKGEKIAIVGKSGSGKTTLIKILMNIIKPSSGKVYINGNEISLIKRECLCKKISVVTQIPFLVGTTIRDNIDYYNNLTDDEVYEALDFAELGDDIRKLPLGLYTHIGEGGQNISGGQRQRIAIARAVASNPEVIIFDEATSNLDAQTEMNIYAALKKVE